MSAFLGPIHSLMYDRIITCQKVINAVGEMAKKQDWGVPVDEYMITEFAPIEDVIDLSNIHASLFEMVVLDGMPCDRGSEIRDDSDNECRLIRNTDLHSAYFVEAGMDGNMYYHFLEAFVRGLLMEYTYKAEEQFRTSLMIVE